MLTSMKKIQSVDAAIWRQEKVRMHIRSRPNPAHTEVRREAEAGIRVSYVLNFLAPRAVRRQQGTSVKQLVSK
jgi:hypothetical protein